MNALCEVFVCGARQLVRHLSLEILGKLFIFIKFQILLVAVIILFVRLKAVHSLNIKLKPIPFQFSVLAT